MKKILLYLPVMLILAAGFGCSEQRKWNREQRKEMREMLRDYRQMAYLNDLTDAEFILFSDDVATALEGDYPVYATFVTMPGVEDTVQLVIVETVVEELQADARNMRHIFPYEQLVARKMLPAGLDHDQLHAFYNCLAGKVNSTFVTLDQFVNAVMADTVNTSTMQRLEGQFLQDGATSMLNSTVSAITDVVQFIVSFALGFVFALNALLQKEKLSMQVKKVLVAFFPERVAKYIVRVGRLSNNAFSSFLSGQCLEAVILGCLIFASMKLLGLPYAVLIAVFIGVMSLIPIIGGFIGCWVGVLLIFMVDWKQAIIFIIMFVVVQQFEGNVIYPHVVGNSVGLPAIWVLVAVTIGGNIAGIVGMIFSIPFCSVLYQLFSEIVNKQIKKKNVDIP